MGDDEAGKDGGAQALTQFGCALVMLGIGLLVVIWAVWAAMQID